MCVGSDVYRAARVNDVQFHCCRVNNSQSSTKDRDRVENEFRPLCGYLVVDNERCFTRDKNTV